jgi:SpoVK/Ycf46/Vps4 family AAA+-type ATPase
MSEASKNEQVGISYLVEKSPSINEMIRSLKSTASMSVSGIINFVVNHENPMLVERILNKSFSAKQLFNETVRLDAVELQHGRPGKGASVRYFDELIYGTYKKKENKDGDLAPDMNEQHGTINRVDNGLVTRAGLKQSPSDGGCPDRILIINNIDYCLDFCSPDKPGVIDTRALFLLDKFRHPDNRHGCTLIFVTNKKLILPFSVDTIEIAPVREFEVKHILNVFIKLYRDMGTKLIINETQVKQIIRKLSGRTYNDACEVVCYCLLRSRTTENGVKVIDMEKALKMLRSKINRDLMDNGFGLTQLESRPWEDYICPEQSEFTYDVKKLMRDFTEVNLLGEERKNLSNSLKKEKDKEKFQEGLTKVESIGKTINGLRTRMPHVIVLYGQGGVGKSAFPVHLAGLLGMDVWDFNINATHSKFIGESSLQMRESISKINETSHIVIRIDEYDRAMGSTNELGRGMHEVHKQVESEFMNWLQNAQEENLFVKKNIFVVMTTNHKENITGPMLRSGRVDLVINIGSFDSESIKETFKTSARRMHNRGIGGTGFDSPEELQEAINSLDLEKISELAVTKMFTVRDIETLILDMASHRYYYNRYGDERGIPWTTESFVKVLENSEGSIKGDSTGELKLGYRDFYKDEPEDIKVEFEDSVTDVEKLKKTNGFTEE